MLLFVTPMNVLANEEENFISMFDVYINEGEALELDDAYSKDYQVGITAWSLISILDELNIPYVLEDHGSGVHKLFIKAPKKFENLTKLEKENEKLKSKIKELENKLTPKVKSNSNKVFINDLSEYIKSGDATSYLDRWDRVTPFTVGDKTYEGNSIVGFKFPYNRNVHEVKLPQLSLRNRDNEHKKLKFSYAIDDLAKNYSSDKKVYICVVGYSELLGYKTIKIKEIERNQQIQTLEIDIEKYTSIKIAITPRSSRKCNLNAEKMSMIGADGYYEVYEDYTILKDIQLIK